ncbi:6-phosphofructokinase [Caminibacter pacificus]|jgi:6-phosphofructokinase 1
MRIGIVCSGGDAPGMNAALKKFVDVAHYLGHEPYFIYDGYEGMIDGKIKKAAHEDVSGILHRGGTIIRSSRSKRFFEYKYRKQAYDNLKKEGIEHIIVLGGDGSFRGLNVLSGEFDISFTGIPATIDNDISFSDYAIGVDTALNVIRDCVDNIRDTASSFRRAFVIETMGRECGYLAAVSAVANGAEICMIPEIKFDWEKNKNRLKEEFENGRSYMIAIVAEGCDATQKMAKWIEESFDIEVRITVLGHVQRGGKPTVQERLIAGEFVYEALNNLDKKNMVVVRNGVNYDFVDIKTLTSTPYKLDEKVLKLLNFLD